ncbi:MAG: S-adenosylmethionine:tRNA ribosyltransferase-isomerase, partial [Cyclobacteriaceae bacterium]|nr:S-adenosylmethionine:tRNA ribosyltransferase-isomerase [Cyclobacteriaceae bacterium]
MILLKDFLYQLPEDRIAKYPLARRDASKLLKYENGKISHHQFKDITNLIPKNSLLVFNNTKVIAARLFFYKESGAKIEIFLTEPIEPYRDFQLVLKAKNTCTWKCMIGNAKKWKGDDLVMSITTADNQDLVINASLVDKDNSLVKFTWKGSNEFLDIIEAGGNVPLPPYLNREAEKEDKDRYQTVFSELEGAVAAPTAGLHFTNEIINTFKEQSIKSDYLTLHVSAGTFRPIKESDFTKHPMHNEKIFISKQNIENLLAAEDHIIPVGTTAMRTLESTYWFGVKLLSDENADFHIDKMLAYKDDPANHPTKQASLEAILKKMEADGVT